MCYKFFFTSENIYDIIYLSKERKKEMFDNDVFSYLSWKDNHQASLIFDFVSNIGGRIVPREEVDSFLRSNDIDYYDLPKHLQDEIGNIDVY